MEWLLAVAVFGIVYPYFIYPLLLATGTRRIREWAAAPQFDLPRVSILVSAFNEEGRIRDKIANFLDLDYPPGSIDLWIGSDGSEDRTAETVRSVNDSRVHLIELTERSGKTAVLNKLAGRTTAEVLIFTDVTALFRRDAVRRLVAPLADPGTGLVSGRTAISGGGEVEVEGAYYRFESFLKIREGAWGLLPGADGAIYALRASLYRPLPAELINDLLHPCQVVADGYAARFEPLAVSQEPAGDSSVREFDRQTRITAQSSYLLAGEFPRLLRSRRWGMLFVLFSHRWLRWIAGIWIPVAGIALAWISPVLAAASLTVLLAILAGWRLGAGWAGLPVYFLLVHTAYLRGLWHGMRGERYVVWKPRAG